MGASVSLTGFLGDAVCAGLNEAITLKEIPDKRHLRSLFVIDHPDLIRNCPYNAHHRFPTHVTVAHSSEWWDHVTIILTKSSEGRLVPYTFHGYLRKDVKLRVEVPLPPTTDLVALRNTWRAEFQNVADEELITYTGEHFPPSGVIGTMLLTLRACRNQNKLNRSEPSAVEAIMSTYIALLRRRLTKLREILGAAESDDDIKKYEETVTLTNRILSLLT